MTLATRCPACGTAFRVVSDQLRVSSGWVRCGRCSSSFDALEHLFRSAPTRQAAADGSVDQASDAVPQEPLLATPPPQAPPAEPALAEPTPASLPPPQDVVGPAAIGAVPSVGESSTPGEPSPIGELSPHAEAAPTDEAPPAGEAAPTQEGPTNTGLPLAEEASPIEAVAPVEQAIPIEDSAPLEAATNATTVADGPVPPPAAGGPAVETGPGEHAAATETVSAAQADLGWARHPGYRPRGRPAFLRRAEAAARWAHPATRTTLALLLIVLAGVLSAQAALLWRDEIALRWPATRPALEAACAILRCRLEAPRRIEVLAVEASDLRSQPDGATYRLEVAIRNRGPIEVLMPALELTLTDASGQLYARRVLSPAEIGSPSRAISAGQEFILQTELVATSPSVAGYTISLFYP